MAIAIEAFSVVLRLDALERLGGISEFQALVPNRTFCQDDHLVRCAFMDRADAVEFIELLFLRGLDTEEGVDPDVTMVTAFDGAMHPVCDWLRVEPYKKGWIGWLEGTVPEFIAAPKGWDPDIESSLQRMSEDEAARRLKFLRREENVEVFLDRDTGRELYVGRTGLPLDQMYEEAKSFLLPHLREPGAPRIDESLEPEVRRCIEMLQILSERRGDSWSVFWLLGKAWHAIGDNVRALKALRQARKIEPGHEAITRELGGICLEEGYADEAIEVAEHAVAGDPENVELLTNLGIAYLLGGRIDEARKSVTAALKHSPEDSVAVSVAGIVEQVASGQRPQPRRLSDLMSRPVAPSPPSAVSETLSRLRGWFKRS